MKHHLLCGMSAALCLAGYTAALPVSAEHSVSEIRIWDGSADTSWFDSEETDFEIATPEAFCGYAQLANAGRFSAKQTVHLTADLYMNDITNFSNWQSEQPVNSWTAINENNGLLDGGGHTIYGLSGKLIETNSGTVQDLHLNSCCILSDNTTITGGIIGNNEGSILHCSYSGNIHISTTNDSYYAGGICGRSQGIIRNCRNEADIDVTIGSSYSTGQNYVYIYFANNRTGGICGWASGEITECVNLGAVSAAIKNTPVFNKPSYYTYSYSTDVFVGGITGGLSGSAEISDLHNAGNISAVSATETTYIGGIAGFHRNYSSENAIQIHDVYNSGELSAESALSYTGGIIGYSSSNLILSNVYNSGSVNNGTGRAIADYLEAGEISAAYYLNTTAIQGVGGIEDTSVSKTEVNMKKPAFAEALGKAFVFCEDAFPCLTWEAEEYPVPQPNNFQPMITDAVFLSKHLICAAELDEKQAENYDINSDGIITATDLSLIKQRLLAA